MIGASEVDLPGFHDGHIGTIRPDILADQRAGECAFVIVILRDPVACAVMDGTVAKFAMASKN